MIAQKLVILTRNIKVQRPNIYCVGLLLKDLGLWM
ncbi:hypothetical protein ES708_15205 [subsurface metagenome]